MIINFRSAATASGFPTSATECSTDVERTDIDPTVFQIESGCASLPSLQFLRPNAAGICPNRPASASGSADRVQT